ncbi:outer membrane beta-barrel protein [Alsobacter sp. KACC 23698]|uniref:Outer membrane beta-barrel protein n=1 Tax=Alsobacter sp. KACC 23698 TaxID=3149229 RepID=A0AAU7JCT5_9HYPH
MALRRRPARYVRLLGLATALACADAVAFASAMAQTLPMDPAAAPVPPPAGMDPDPYAPALRGSGPTSMRQAYKGAYAPVGQPVRPPKKTKPRTLRQTAPAPVPAPLFGPAAGTAPDLAGTLPTPGLPAIEQARRARRKAVQDDPYAPLGIDTGGLIWRPSIDVSGGYDTNPNRVGGRPRGSTTFRQEGALSVESDWERHAFTANLRGAYQEYPSVRSANRPDGAGVADLRIDVLRDTQVDLGAAYLLTTERPGSLEQPVVGSKRSTILTAGTSAMLTQRFGAVAVSLRGAVDRTSYGDLTQANGLEVSQGDRDFNAYGLRLRTGYQATPGLQPFVEATVDKRVYDSTLDVSGYDRTSSGVQGRVGSTFEITRTVTGEASAGYGVRQYEDPRLADLRGPVADVALIWSATPLTTVTLRGTASLAETTVVGATGAQVRTVAAEVSHALLRNLILVGAASFTSTDYQGVPLRETSYATGLKLEYRLTRSVALNASFTHERLNGATVGSDYTANTFLVGMKLQP